MTLLDAQLGGEYMIKEIVTDDEELDAFLFSLGCYSGEPITVVSRKKKWLCSFHQGWKLQHRQSACRGNFNIVNRSLAGISGPFSYLLIPIAGFASWQLAAAAITGFIAKENVVGTLAVCYAITNFSSGIFRIPDRYTDHSRYSWKWFHSGSCGSDCDRSICNQPDQEG